MFSQQLSRKRWQVRIAACAAMIAGIGLAAACSSSGDGSQAGSSGKITVTEVDYYTSGAANTFWKTAVAEYHKLHPNVTIKRTAAPNTSSYVPQLTSEASAGTLPNIVMIDNPYVAQFAKAGVLMPLRQIGPINTSGMNQTLLPDGEYHGTLYAIQFYTDSMALGYNKTLFAAKHLSPPKTWADMLVDAKKLTTSKVYGFAADVPAAGGAAFWNFSPFLWSSAGANATENLAAPKAVAALNLWVQMVRDGSMPKDVAVRMPSSLWLARPQCPWRALGGCRP
jgi:multiple sugar transport system substrate-binding protein